MFEAIIYWIVLADSLIANILAWLYPKWYKRHFKRFAKRLPLTRGWAGFYLLLVIWIGLALHRLGILPY